jgi:hypothetical protein
MRPGVAWIVGMSKVNLRHHLFHHVEQILFGPFSDLSGGQTCSGMGHKQRTETFDEFPLRNHRIELIGQIDDFFLASCLDPQGFHR